MSGRLAQADFVDEWAVVGCAACSQGGRFNLSERLAQPNLVDEWAVGYVDDGFDAHHTTTIITTTKTTTNTQTAITITTLTVHLE